MCILKCDDVVIVIFVAIVISVAIVIIVAIVISVAELHNSSSVAIVINSCFHDSMEEAADAVDDSDDEVDYTKMDQGNKKGPVGRWDFDTQEEYSDYMANKEALPK